MKLLMHSKLSTMKPLQLGMDTKSTHTFVGHVNFLHKWPVTPKMFPFEDIILYVRSPYTKRLEHCEGNVWTFVAIIQHVIDSNNSLSIVSANTDILVRIFVKKLNLIPLSSKGWGKFHLLRKEVTYHSVTVYIQYMILWCFLWSAPE